MASPFSIFRKYSGGMMVVMVILSMLLFTLTDLFTDTQANLWLLGMLVGGAIFGIAGIGQGRWLQWGIGGAILGAALGFILPGFVDSGGIDSELGVIDEEEMYDLELRRSIANQFIIRATEASFGEGMGRFARVFGFGHASSREDVVFGKLLRAEADRLGIAVSDQMVTDYLKQATSDKLTREAYIDARNALAYNNQTLNDELLMGILSDELKAQMAYQLLRPRTASMPPAPEVYWEYFRRLNVRQQINITTLDVDEFLDDVEEPPDTEVEETFARYAKKFPNQDEPGSPGFRLPFQARLAWVELDSQDVEGQIAEITDKDIEKYYEDNRETPLIRRPVMPDFDDDKKPADPEADSDSSDDKDGTKDNGQSDDKKSPDDKDGSAADKDGSAADKDGSAEGDKANSKEPNSEDTDADAEKTNAAEPKTEDQSDTKDADAANKDDAASPDNGSAGDSKSDDGSSTTTSDDADASNEASSGEEADASNGDANDGSCGFPDESAASDDETAATPADSDEAAGNADEKSASDSSDDTAAEDSASGGQTSDNSSDVTADDTTTPDANADKDGAAKGEDNADTKDKPAVPESTDKKDTGSKDGDTTKSGDAEQPKLTIPPADPEAQDDVPENFKEPQYEYRELDDELKEEIREEILRQRIGEIVDTKMKQLQVRMDTLASDRSKERFSRIEADSARFEGDLEEKTEALEQLRDDMRDYDAKISEKLKAYAEENDLAYVETPLISFSDLLGEDYPIGRATEPPAGGNPMFAPQMPSVAETVFRSFSGDIQNNEAQVFQVRRAQRSSESLDGGTFYYAYWAIDYAVSHVPELSEDGVREAVVKAIKRTKARELAQKRGEELAKLVRSGLAKEGEDKEDMTQILKDVTVTGSDESPALAVRTSRPFSWMKTSSASPMSFQQQQATMSQIEFSDGSDPLEGVDSEFMETIFNDMVDEEVRVVPNAFLEKYYVVHVTNRFPTPEIGEDGLRERFANEGRQFAFASSPIAGVMQQELAGPAGLAWERALWQRYGINPDGESDEAE